MAVYDPHQRLLDQLRQRGQIKKTQQRCYPPEYIRRIDGALTHLEVR